MKLPNDSCCVTCGVGAGIAAAGTGAALCPSNRRSTKTCRMKFCSGARLVLSTIGHPRSFSVPYHPARNCARAASFPISPIKATSSSLKSEFPMDFTLN